MIVNPQSLEWKAVEVEIDTRVYALDRLNRTAKSEVETAHIRGQIAALLSLRDWPKAAAIPEEPETFPPI